ncbi:MAG: hypothetical protein UR53_C0001G0039 [Candidatus Magasanikbacteria bacterium GW2011_GWC2_34_16]|uniref:Fimbrial assembly family protein n=2 Tax=Candidatus Magasanikiibacteriota TaxID=1752731 RepID=A0A0G0HCQ6_9BACT|nr:MAG: hypothetical protein UR53_C0001G0039 [Candidatus Magasanikbacteria bacterium GW2011_GWC2_34_16]KKQ40973.1 MAG: hypothetical protein US58_C0008G0002 [Candidatus Magasanikbacteria bacterium GW2011_GWA2_37_8]
MFNVTLNLIPPDKKNHLKNLVRFIFIREILEIIIFISAMLAISLLWSWMVLQDQFNNLANSAILVNRDYSKYNTEIRTINSAVKNISQSSQGYFPVSPKIADIIDTLPNDIKINSIEINRTQNKITIAGTALTREAFLNYQAVCQSIPWLEKVETPTSQLFQKENISFEIKANLKNFVALPKTK